MNCKPGDMAMVIKGLSSGRFCTCERLASLAETSGSGYDVEMDGPMWVTDKLFPSTHGDEDYMMFDDWLMPIRPQPAAYEMVQKLGKPEGELV